MMATYEFKKLQNVKGSTLKSDYKAAFLFPCC